MVVDIETLKCDECNCSFKKDSSEMIALCPECAHHLYDYVNCTHEFENGKCKICFGDSSEW